MSLLALPLFFFVFMVHFNFYFAMIMLFFENLFAEGWMSPCIAMIQQVVDTKYKAVSIGVFFWGTAMAQSLSCVVVGQLLNDYHLTDKNVEKLGTIIFFNTALPCVLAAFCFYKSADPFVKQRMEMMSTSQETSEKQQSGEN